MYENAKYLFGGKFISRGTWCHPDRLPDNAELILVLKGHFSMTEEGIEYPLQPGDVLRLDAFARHWGTDPTTDTVSFYWVHFVGADKADLPPKHFRPSSTAQAELLIRQLLHYGENPDYPADCADALLKVLLAELNHTAPQTGGRQTVNTILQWIKYNEGIPLRVSDVAAHFGYNEDYLNRLFKRFYPQGLKAYLDECRLQAITHDLLHEDISLQTLASKHGFTEYKYFLKFFKYHTGLSPTQYRKTYSDFYLNSQ